MIPRNSESKNLKALKKLPLVQSIDEERWETLTPHISFTELDEGDALFTEGHQSENLFLVMEGELRLHLPGGQSEVNFYLHSRHKGETAGDFAVLNGGSHLVTAIATKNTRVARFPRFAFELLANINPTILAHVYDTAAELSRRVMLAKVFLDMFGDITTEAMNDLLDGTDIRHYTSGEVLIEEGDEADGLHIVVSGRLQVETVNEENNTVVLAEVRAPETVGEQALLSDSVRSATVYAIRESTVAFLNKALFHELIAQQPNMLMPLSKLIVQRHVEKSRRTSESFKDQAIAIIPLDRRLPLRRFLHQLKREMRTIGNPLLLDARGFDTLYGKKGVAQTDFSDVFNSAVAEWLDDKENSYQEILYLTDPSLSSWTKRCLNRADRIILLADASKENSSKLREIEHDLRKILQNARYHRKVDLVLLHAKSTDQPSHTARWLRKRELNAYHHIRIDDAEHMARLARRICGCARGIVFSGGGARGYAHLGVQKVIEEHGIDIDYIGGSSMGGLLGASMAMGLDTEAINRLSRVFANKRALFDYTLPLASLLKSAKLTRFCHEVYKEVRIEDLWIPFFCVSSNLADGKEVIHDRGPLWRVVRSTISLPGIFSPVPTPSGQLLIDGAVLNTFPVDIMQEQLGGRGSIIGVNVSQIVEIREYYNYGTSLSGWHVLMSRINPFAKKIRIPRLVETLLRSTDIKSIIRLNETKAMLDILVEPDVSEIPLMEFKSYERISEIGYQEAISVFLEHELISSEMVSLKQDLQAQLEGDTKLQTQQAL